MKYQVPKGLFDIVPYMAKEDWQISSYWQYIEKVVHALAKDYCYQEIRTPLFEQKDLFSAGVGTTSDIVSKEMYTFSDKANRQLALRPEGTSSTLRSFVERNFSSFKKAHKLYYIAPMFRYERPQSGRYRQHHQFGIEVLGISSYEQDAEVIDMLYELYKRLGLKNLEIQINSVGDIDSRLRFRKALIDFLKPNLKNLSEDSQLRFEKNPLRILDSKDLGDQDLLKNVPSILDYLSPSLKDHFNGLCSTLEFLKIPFTINPKIVRGLDYYNKTVFEIQTTDLGAQNALGGGGRYDGFTSVFGGQSLPGIGFGTGLERILQTMLKQNVKVPDTTAPYVYFIPLGEKARELVLGFCSYLRHQNIPCNIDLASKKIQDALQKANKEKAEYTMIIGSDEIGKKECRLKNMIKREEESISMDNICKIIEKKWEKK